MNQARRLSLVLCVALLAPSAAMAEEELSQDEARARARELAQEAGQHYRLGRFQEALDAYQAAYDLAPAPGVFFNLGQCQRQLGNHERALFFFRSYLAELPDAPNREVVEQLVAASAEELERQREIEALEAERALESARAEREAQEAERVEAERQAEEERRAEEERAAAEARASEERPVHRTWWFWTIIGGVAAAAGVGVGLGVALYEPETTLPGGSLGTLDGR